MDIQPAIELYRAGICVQYLHGRVLLCQKLNLRRNCFGGEDYILFHGFAAVVGTGTGGAF